MSALGYVGLGLAILVIAAELIVGAATRLARALGVRPLVLGLTVVAIGTSAPELAVGITANLQGSGGLAVGNIAGTNVFNVLFILGLSAFVRPLPLHMQVFKLELPAIIVSAMLMIALAWDGVLSRLDGGLMLLLGGIYTIALIGMSRIESASVAEEFAETFSDPPSGRRLRLPATRLGNAVVLVVGICLSVLGAHWLVAGSVDLARGLGISDAVIGLTVVAIGTSAPELITTIVATRKGDREVAVGNLLGSSI